MNKAQRERFQRAGWKVGTVGELLELTPVEEDLIETKLRLGGLVRALRERSHLSQAALAKRIGSSQPRVAKIEATTRFSWPGRLVKDGYARAMLEPVHRDGVRLDEGPPRQE